MSATDATRSPLEVEILAEQVRSLTQATRVLEEALLRLEQAGRGARTAALLEEARRRLWNLLVQREAMGIIHHEMLLEILRVPPEVRAGAGVRAAGTSVG
jgi:hypothetical protein